MVFLLLASEFTAVSHSNSQQIQDAVADAARQDGFGALVHGFQVLGVDDFAGQIGFDDVFLFQHRDELAEQVFVEKVW